MATILIVVSLSCYSWFFTYSLCLALKNADFFRENVFLKLPAKLRIVIVVLHILCFVVCCCIMIVTVGMFARGEMSPLPWTAFNKHGLLDALAAFIIILFTDLWLLWIPSQLWIGFVKKNRYQSAGTMALCTTQVFIMARIINVLFGLLLMSESNPIYKVTDTIARFFRM
jgi:hypothetical protein